MKELTKEQQHLDYLVSEFYKLSEIEQKNLDDIILQYRKDPKHFEHIVNNIKVRLETLKKAIQNPFFGRIIFDNEEKKITNDIYIGRVGVQDENNQILVVDWRAPISSLYYDGELGKTSYEVLGNTISGYLRLKRQFEIENHLIKNYYDIDIVANDQLLQSYLGVNNDKRLKNIVATIQREQNDIVRKPINTNLIIQGVAGCGKTTVALHRIAYLAYNYKNTIRPSQYMVIGPNKVFMDYIKTVLPDLDVNDVCQQTFEDFAIKYINTDYSIISNKNLYDTNNIRKIKSSLVFRDMLDSYLNDFISSIVDKDLVIKNFKVVDQNVIKNYFNQFLLTSPTLANVVEKTINQVNNYINENLGNILSKLSDETYILLKNEVDPNRREEIKSRHHYIKREIEQRSKSNVKKLFSKANKDVIKIYEDFLKNIAQYDNNRLVNIEMLKKETLTILKNKQLEFEDLSPLMYISYRIKQNNFSNFRHVVIDEAQDLGQFNFFILKQILNNATFSMYGDLAQSIYDYRSIDSWDEVNKIFDGSCEVINLNKSYRTTDEIMKAADLILERLDLDKSEDVIRHGDNVSINNVSTDDMPAYIIGKVEEFKKKGYKSIAIISKNDLQTKYINGDLYIEGLYANLVTSQSSDYNINNDIVTISNPLSKGLEFDAVIINDCSEEVYNSANPLDMKLLYVAMTRALHELDITYSKELTKPLQQLLDKNKKYIKK